MLELLQSQLDKFLLFTLVLARVSGLAMTAPVFGASGVPITVRALLAFTLSILIAPVTWHTPFAHPGSVFNYLTYVGVEVLIGVVLGMGLVILFMGLHVAGRLIGMSSGMSLADALSGGTFNGLPVHGQLLYFVTLAVFVAIGGHRMLIRALLETFSGMPVGSAMVPATLVDTATTLVTYSFSLGIRAAAPVVTALLLSTLALGLISRTMPQMNILAVGFGLNAMLTLALLSVSLGAIAFLFQEQIEPVLTLLVETFRTTAAPLTPPRASSIRH